jgi:hypothetical protein
VPFAARPVWDVTPDGTMITGDGVSYDLHEVDGHGQVITRFTRAVAPDRIPQHEPADGREHRHPVRGGRVGFMTASARPWLDGEPGHGGAPP